MKSKNSGKSIPLGGAGFKVPVSNSN